MDAVFVALQATWQLATYTRDTIEYRILVMRLNPLLNIPQPVNSDMYKSNSLYVVT